MLLKSKIRVLHILPTMRGYGAERLIVELLARLASPQIDPALLTIYELKDGAGRVDFPVFQVGRTSKRDRLFLARLVRLIRGFAPDIVHTHTHVGKYWGRIGAALAGVATIVHTEHNPCDPRRTVLERGVDNLLHRATSRIVTFFPEQAASLSEFERIPSNKLTVIPNGLTNDKVLYPERTGARQSFGVEPSRFAILVIGRLEYQKNHVLALRAFAATREPVRRKMLLLFAGAGENEQMLSTLAQTLGIGDSVRFLGFRTDVPALLAAADLVLMTSWFEGMPLALLEAMLAGVPILSTPWIGARAMLGDGRFGFITPDYEPARVAAEIERVAAQPALLRQIADRARRQALDSYSFEHMLESHRDLYFQLRGAA
jgi:glycosyltransferase involved in cell wall biosynthesis